MKFIFIRVRRMYGYCITIPDRLYPFSEEVNGKKVRWRSAYDQALARIQSEYGYGHYGPWLVTYRGVFHVIGAILFILFSILISKELFGSEGALYLLFSFVAAGILYQEMYIQKHSHGQLLFHSFVDWFSWIIPLVIYLYAHTHNINLSEWLDALADRLS